MAKVTGPLSGGFRKPSARGVIVYDTWRGVDRARKWPKKAKRPRSTSAAWWTEWFRQANIVMNYAAAVDTETARRVTRGTIMRARDLQMAAMAGRMFQIGTTDGREIFSMAQYRDVSASLDTISQVKGDLIVRSDDLWIPLKPGPIGQVLTSQGPGELPAWAPGGGGGSGYIPPTLDSLPTWVNQGGSIAEQSPAGPLVISRLPPGSTPNVSGRFQALKTPPAEYILGFRVVTVGASGESGGVWLRDSASNRLIRWNLRNDEAAESWTLTIDRYANESTFSAVVRREQIARQGTAFLRITDDGTNFTFYWSQDAAAWLQFHRESRTAWLASPDQIGIALDAASTSGAGQSIAGFHWIAQAN